MQGGVLEEVDVGYEWRYLGHHSSRCSTKSVNYLYYSITKAERGTLAAWPKGTSCQRSKTGRDTSVLSMWLVPRLVTCFEDDASPADYRGVAHCSDQA